MPDLGSNHSSLAFSCLDIAKRADEAEALIQEFKVAFAVEPSLRTAWLDTLSGSKTRPVLLEIAKAPSIEDSTHRWRAYLFHAGLTEEASGSLTPPLRDSAAGGFETRFDELVDSFMK